MSELQPMRGWCILERMEVPAESEGGIILPETAREHSPGPFAPYEATVVAVGGTLTHDDGTVEAADFEPGDRVLAQWSNLDLDDKRKQHKYGRTHIVRIRDVIGVLGEGEHLDPIPAKQSMTGDRPGRYAPRRGNR